MYELIKGFVCGTVYYPNCRVHDCEFYNGLMFFNTFEEVLDYAIKNIHEIEIKDLHALHGEPLGKFTYELSGHNCSGIVFETNYDKLRTVDDGKGNLIWKEE